MTSIKDIPISDGVRRRFAEKHMPEPNTGALSAEGRSIPALAEQFRISTCSARLIVRGKTWRNVL